MSDLIVAGHLANNPRAVALMGNLGQRLLGRRYLLVGSETYAVARVWPSYDGITGQPDWQSHVWFVELDGKGRLPEYGSRAE